ncbi:MAG: TonB-dependent receptor [Deltaproteobacteria bacterium]|nr:TonB-dependent receptor [Deltaproteobacteria bacterium]
MALSLILAGLPATQPTIAPADEGGDTDDGLDDEAVPEWDEITSDALDEIVVNSTAIEDTAVRKQVVTSEQIQERGAKTLGEALEDQLGIQSGTRFYEDRGGPQGIQMQGCDPKRVLILIDGKRVVGTADGIVDTSQLPLGNVERVEVIKGASSALYGSDAICGVVNIITRDAPTQGTHWHNVVEFGSYNARQILSEIAARPRPDLGVTAGFDHNRRDAIDLDKSDVDTNADRFWSGKFSGGLEWDPDSPLRLEADGEITMEERDGTFSRDFAGLDQPYVYDTPWTIYRPSASLAATWQFNNVDFVTARVYDNYFQSESVESLRDSPARRSRTTYNNYANASLTGAWGLGLWNTLSGGVEFGEETLQVRKSEISANNGVDFAEDTTVEVAPKVSSTAEVFAQDEIKPIDRLTLVPGARYTYNNRFGDVVTPKISLWTMPTDGLVARASYGRGYRAPSLKELFYIFDHSNLGYIVQGNDELRPETSDSYNAGVEITPWDDALIEANGFYNRYDDLIDILLEPIERRGSVSVYEFRNIGRARTYGGEFQASFDFLDRFSALGGYVLLFAENQELDTTLPNRPRHQLKGKLSFEHEDCGFKAVAFADYRSFVYVDDEERTTSPEYVTVDAYVEQRLARGLRLYLRGENLTDTKPDPHNPNDLRPIPGVEIFGGLILDFDFPASNVRDESPLEHG